LIIISSRYAAQIKQMEEEEEKAKEEGESKKDK